MAKLKQSRSLLVFETSQAVFEDGGLRPVIVDVQSGFALLRLRGARKSFAVPWGAVYHLAAAQEAERELRARKAAMGV